MTPWYLTTAWLRGSEPRVNKIANRLGQNDMAYVRYWVTAALYPRWDFKGYR